MNRFLKIVCLGAIALGFIVTTAPVRAQDSDMRGMIERFSADRDSLMKKYSFSLSPVSQTRLAQFYRMAQNDLKQVNFSALDRDGQIDYLLLKNRLEYLARTLEIETDNDLKIQSALPGLHTFRQYWEEKLQGKPIDGQQAAADLTAMQKEVEQMLSSLASPSPELEALLQDPTVALWALKRLPELKRNLQQWDQYYAGYDPQYSWWTKKPVQELTAAYDRYESALRRKVLGSASEDQSAIVGQPIGRDALYAELKSAMIAYSPEELVQIAQQEMQWCDREMDKAAAELGFDDWHDAQEAVKQKFVPPGQQPYLIREMAEEATDYVIDNDLVTVPDLAREVWRMSMMSPQRQKVSPYFLGGDTIIVSYPTDEMTHEEKLMSLRGNNPHFSRAVVHHELIPGHHLQQFMTQRYRPYRQEFRTPFWIEGWALYWEMLLWDRGFARGPEDRIGMLFWRKHRCARIIFSLSYHLKQMTAQQCIDYLVERVGHERNNATAEVRRSIMGGYGPLYQAAYMLGGLQIRSLQYQWVESGKMSYRDFHDFILQQNAIPIEMIRARMEATPLSPDWEAGWRFYPPPAGATADDRN